MLCGRIYIQLILNMCRSDPATTTVSLSTDHMYYMKVEIGVYSGKISDEYWNATTGTHVRNVKKHSTTMKTAKMFV